MARRWSQGKPHEEPLRNVREAIDLNLESSPLALLWAYSRPGGDVLFEWQVSRVRDGPEKFLKTFRGKLQTDGYAAYESLAKERVDLILVGCWAHTRRGFHEASAESKLAAWFVRQMFTPTAWDRAKAKEKMVAQAA
jgi:hypothetical protein